MKSLVVQECPVHYLLWQHYSWGASGFWCPRLIHVSWQYAGISTGSISQSPCPHCRSLFNSVNHRSPIGATLAHLLKSLNKKLKHAWSPWPALLHSKQNWRWDNSPFILLSTHLKTYSQGMVSALAQAALALTQGLIRISQFSISVIRIASILPRARFQ